MSRQIRVEHPTTGEHMGSVGKSGKRWFIAGCYSGGWYPSEGNARAELLRRFEWCRDRPSQVITPSPYEIKRA